MIGEQINISRENAHGEIENFSFLVPIGWLVTNLGEYKSVKEFMDNYTPGDAWTLYEKALSDGMTQPIEELKDKLNKVVTAYIDFEKTFNVRGFDVNCNSYEHNGKRYVTAWLNGSEEIETIEYTGSVDADTIYAIMEEFVFSKADYIEDIANWDGN